MMLIRLKFLSPTNHRGDRIKAITNQLTKTYQWDYSVNHTDNYRKAALQIYSDIKALHGNDYMSPPCSAQLFILKDEFYAIVKNSADKD